MYSTVGAVRVDGHYDQGSHGEGKRGWEKSPREILVHLTRYVPRRLLSMCARRRMNKSHSRSQRSLRTAPEVGPSSSSHAEHKSASRKEYMRANPWVDGFERIHTRPQKGTSGISADDVDIIPGPPGHMSPSRIDEESMSNRMSSAGSKAIPRDRKPKLEVDVATTNTTVTETKSTLNRSSDAGPSLRRDRSNGAFPSWGNVPREAYAWSRHTPPAAINTTSPQVESPLNGTEESGASRQTVTPSLDEFPFPLPPSDSHYRNSASFFTTTPNFSEFPSTVANGHSPPGYQTNNTTYAVRHPQGQTGAAVPMLPLYSSRTVSHQTRAWALSNSATSDETLETIGTVTSQPAVVAVQQARRVSFLGPAHAVAVPSDAGHFDMPRAV